MLTTLAIANYRSLREFIAPLGRLNIVTGPNGSGKSNVYRALRLLAVTARGGVIPSLAREGGRPSALLVDRQGASIRTRDDHGDWQTIAQPVASFDSMMTEFSDPRTAPEMIAVRETIRSWRFYDHFRTDSESPVRLPQIGTHTPVLSDDGADLAAALQTIREIGDPIALDAAIDDAFPGSRIEITSLDGRFEVRMHQHGLLRPLKGAELSDGTLRYLLLVAALLTPRPPALLVLNEPETSLHPDLLAALARLIARASQHSQVLVVSHAARLIAALEREGGSQSIVLEKQLGATRMVGADDLDLPAWKWPAR